MTRSVITTPTPSKLHPSCCMKSFLVASIRNMEAATVVTFAKTSIHSFLFCRAVIGVLPI